MLEKSFAGFFEEAPEYIILESAGEVIQHLTHLEELVLTRKKEGFDIAIGFLNNLYETLKGNSTSETFVSIKYDGAPSVIAGYNPENKQFFVSTKSIGNVNPKINYSELDIDKNHGHSAGLSQKLKQALKYLPNVINQGIYQGDFLFSQEDLKQQNIEGEDLIVFKPNTITYAGPEHSSLGLRIKQAKIGIIFHTKYSGINLKSLTKNSNVNVLEFNQTSDVFVDDAKFKDMSGIVSFTDKESRKFEQLLKKANSLGNKIKWDTLTDQNYEHLNTFINSLIREGKFVEDPVEDFQKFIQWILARGQRVVDGMKSEKGKLQKNKNLMSYVSALKANPLNVSNLIKLSIVLEQAKRLFVEKYNSLISTKQFITQPDGSLKVTNPEGYVAVDKSGNMVKLIDRLEFSKANFSISKQDKFKSNEKV